MKRPRKATAPRPGAPLKPVRAAGRPQPFQRKKMTPEELKAELDAAAEITDDDVAAAVAQWRLDADPRLRYLLDAELMQPKLKKPKPKKRKP